MLSRRISVLRTEQGMTQSQLAKMLHISASTIGMYEQGHRTPGIDILVELSKIFGVSLDYLITGTDYLYTDATTRISQIAKKCPCTTCCWKNNVEQEPPNPTLLTRRDIL